MFRFDSKTCQAHLDSGFPIESTFNFGNTMLMVAVDLSYGMCEMLLKNGANPNSSNKAGATPLILAVCNGNIDIARLLLDYGALVDKATNGGMTPLMIASDNNEISLAKFLLESGADVNKMDKNGSTPLHHALPCSNEFLQLLINHGANLDVVNGDGWTPLMVTFGRSYCDNALTLFKSGAKCCVDGECAWSIATDFIQNHFDNNGFCPHHRHVPTD